MVDTVWCFQSTPEQIEESETLVKTVSVLQPEVPQPSLEVEVEELPEMLEQTREVPSPVLVPVSVDLRA